jgi:hypothetical protein
MAPLTEAIFAIEAKCPKFRECSPLSKRSVNDIIWFYCANIKRIASKAKQSVQVFHHFLLKPFQPKLFLIETQAKQPFLIFKLLLKEK